MTNMRSHLEKRGIIDKLNNQRI